MMIFAMGWNRVPNLEINPFWSSWFHLSDFTLKAGHSPCKTVVGQNLAPLVQMPTMNRASFLGCSLIQHWSTFRWSIDNHRLFSASHLVTWRAHGCPFQPGPSLEDRMQPSNMDGRPLAWLYGALQRWQPWLIRGWPVGASSRLFSKSTASALPTQRVGVLCADLHCGEVDSINPTSISPIFL